MRCRTRVRILPNGWFFVESLDRDILCIPVPMGSITLALIEMLSAKLRPVTE